MSALTRRSFVRLIFFIAGCLAIGFLGGLATSSSLQDWYLGIRKPPLNPPNWIFAPVWSVLYIMMAIAGWRLWALRSTQKNRLRILFALQLIFNALWSFLFFGLRNPFFGLVDILLLWAILFLLTCASWRADKISGLILLPYLLWTSFATYLNAALWWLNRQ